MRPIEIHGEVHPDFRTVAYELQRQLEAARVGGAGVCVYYKGEPVVDIWGGDRDRGGVPWERDTTSLSFSTTKGVTATAVHVLADRGLIDYDTPVAEYWPEFAAAGKAKLTVRKLLAHQAGLHRIRSMIGHADEMLDWDHMTATIAATRPAFEPGTRSAYHGITFGWLAGELVRRVSGKSVGAFVQTEIAEPLGLDGLTIGVQESELGRIARMTRASALLGRDDLMEFGAKRRLTRDPVEAFVPEGFFDLFWAHDHRVHRAEIPAANGVFTARSLARLYATLANGGQLDGTYLVSPDTVRKASAIQSRHIDLVAKFPLQWRLGYHLSATTLGVIPGAFGHWGYGGSGAYAVPGKDLAVAMVLNRIAGSPFGDMRILELGRVTLAAVRRLQRPQRR